MTNHETEGGVKLPEFGGNELDCLSQLLELARQRPENKVWYIIERQTGQVATIVAGLLNAHEYQEESARFKGEEPIKFADYVIDRLTSRIEILLARASDLRQAAVAAALASQVEFINTSETPTPTGAETADHLARRVRFALGGSNNGRQGRRHYSNSHHRRRR